MDPTLYNLLIQDAQFLHGAETEQSSRLRELMETVGNEELRSLFAEHAQETDQQIRRLEEILGAVGEEPANEVPIAVQGLVDDAETVADQELGPDVRDVAIAAAARKMEHYEIACYETALAIAEQLGVEEIIVPLRESLEEERRADQRIAAAAMAIIQAQIPRETEPVGSPE